MIYMLTRQKHTET